MRCPFLPRSLSFSRLLALHRDWFSTRSKNIYGSCCFVTGIGAWFVHCAGFFLSSIFFSVAIVWNYVPFGSKWTGNGAILRCFICYFVRRCANEIPLCRFHNKCQSVMFLTDKYLLFFVLSPRIHYVRCVSLALTSCVHTYISCFLSSFCHFHLFVGFFHTIPSSLHIIIMHQSKLTNSLDTHTVITHTHKTFGTCERITKRKRHKMRESESGKRLNDVSNRSRKTFSRNEWTRKTTTEAPHQSLTQKRKTDNVLDVIYRTLCSGFLCHFRMFLLFLATLSLCRTHTHTTAKCKVRNNSGACSKNVRIWFMSNVERRTKMLLFSLLESASVKQVLLFSFPSSQILRGV